MNLSTHAWRLPNNPAEPWLSHRKDGHFEMAHSEELPLAGEQASLPRPPAPPQQLPGQLPTPGGKQGLGLTGGKALGAAGKEAPTQTPHQEQEHDDQDQDHGHGHDRDQDQDQDMAEGLQADGGASEAGQVSCGSSYLNP